MIKKPSFLYISFYCDKIYWYFYHCWFIAYAFYIYIGAADQQQEILRACSWGMTDCCIRPWSSVGRVPVQIPYRRSSNNIDCCTYFSRKVRNIMSTWATGCEVVSLGAIFRFINVLIKNSWLLILYNFLNCFLNQ